MKAIFKNLHAYMHRLIQFSDKEKAIIEDAFTFRQLPRKFSLTREGEVARELYFINKGLLRLFYNKEGEEITGYIFKENLFASSYESFLLQQPSIQNLETLEDCELLVTTLEEFDELHQRLPKMNILTRRVAEQRFINAQKILSSFILESPEQRYRRFEEEHKDLLQRVPQHIIASYLGITAVSLSRIRKRLAP